MGRVVVGEHRVQFVDRALGAGRQAGEGGDPTGQSTQVGCAIADQEVTVRSTVRVSRVGRTRGSPATKGRPYTRRPCRCWAFSVSRWRWRWRGALARILRLPPTRVRVIRQPELDELGDQFRAATVGRPNRDDEAHQWRCNAFHGFSNLPTPRGDGQIRNGRVLRLTGTVGHAPPIRPAAQRQPFRAPR